MAADDSASWRFDGLVLVRPGARSRVCAGNCRHLEDFTPSVAITVTGRQDGSVAFLGRDVRFMQTRRAKPWLVPRGPSIFDYPAMNVVETGGVARTVEVNALAALEFDANCGYPGHWSPGKSIDTPDLAPGQRSTSTRSGEPPGHRFLLGPLAQGLIVDVGGGMQVIIPFRQAKRIELGWLE